MHNLKITDVRVLPGDSGFLIDDGNTAILYDSGFGFTGENLGKKIQDVLGKRQLDYIFLSHSHYDHVLGSIYVKRIFPNAKIVAGSYANKIFKKDSAKNTMMQLDKTFALKNGIGECDYTLPIDDLWVDIEVNDGDIIQCGQMIFQILSLPGHTKCSVGFYLEKNKLLLGSETLGVYFGNEFIIPSYLVGYDLTIQSFNKVEKLNLINILVPHYGLLSCEKTRFYLERGRKNAEETAQDIINSIKAGKSQLQIFEDFKNKYYVDSVKEIYPYDAMELNTNIMINLIRKEFELD